MKIILIGGEPVDHALAFANGVAADAPVTLVAPRTHFEGLAGALSSGIDLRLMDVPRHRSPANPGYLARLTRLVRGERPDIVHLLSNTALWLNLALPFWRPVPLVTTVHDTRLHPGDRDTATLPGWSPRLIARQSGDLLVHGEGLRYEAARVFDKPADRVHVLPHPAMPRYAELARAQGMHRRPDRPFTVLMFGRIFAYKGLETLVRAEAIIGDALPDMTVVIAGRGDDPRAALHLTNRPERYDIRARYISDTEVAQLFLDADLVVLPYREASQSGVLPVAATFGCPVVVTDVGELAATVTPQGMGLVVPPDDPGALASAILRMAREPELRRACGSAARDWANCVASPRIVGAGARALYARIVRRTRDSPPKG